MTGTTVRMGILGAAAIAPGALIEPASADPDVEVIAIAARDRDRAAEFAVRHRLEGVEDSYDSLLARRDIEAVYVPLPVGLRVHWIERALRAGKHVLAEKPLAPTASQARRAVDLADDLGLILMEGFHYRYHPQTERVLEILRSGELGDLRSIDVVVDWTAPPSPVYWDVSLGGGNTGHAACYAVHLIRSVGGAEPRVVESRTDVVGGVDTAIRARLELPDGVSATISSSMVASRADMSAVVSGSRGDLTVESFIAPHGGGAIAVRLATGSRREQPDPLSSFAHQLRAFVAAVRTGRPPITGGEDAVANSRVVDALLAAAKGGSGA